MASRSRSVSGQPRKAAGRGSTTRSSRREPKAVETPPTTPRFRSGNTVRAALVVATLIAGGALAYIPVQDYLDLRGELRELQDEGGQLSQDLLDAEQAIRLAQSRNADRARCYANYVAPGSESYSIPGSSGCVQ